MGLTAVLHSSVNVEKMIKQSFINFKQREVKTIVILLLQKQSWYYK